MRKMLLFISLCSLLNVMRSYPDTNPYKSILAVRERTSNAFIEIGMKKKLVVESLGEPQESQGGGDGFIMMRWDKGIMLYIDNNEEVVKIVISSKQYDSIVGLVVGDTKARIIEKLGNTFDEWKEWMSYDLVYGAWLMQFKVKNGLIEEMHICRAGD